MRVIRVLEYQGDEAAVKSWLANRFVRGSLRLMHVRMGAPEIKERFVVPEPKPEWWEAVVGGVEEKDPTEGGE